MKRTIGWRAPQARAKRQTRDGRRGAEWLRVLVLAMTCVTATAAGGVVVAARADKKPAFKVEEATIADIQQAIMTKRVTTAGIVEQYLTRIKAYNGTCVNQPEGLLGPISTIPHAGQLNALGTLNLRPETRKHWGFDDHHARSMTDLTDTDPAQPDALETAAKQDAEFARTGKLVGPLQGVVVAIKDQYDTFDMRTTNGADVGYADDRPPRDSTVVERLRQAGAIILAKANRGGYGSRSAFGGTVCNPYDTERTPRGSSSGSAVGVSANLVTCAIGEETGTSIRIPSSSSNVVGLSPTQELVSRAGMSGPGLTVREGPICRTVEDAGRMLTAVIGYDAKDPFTAFSVGKTPAKPYQSFITGTSLDGVRIGVVREFMDASLFTVRDQEAIGIVDRAIVDLKKTGATVVDPGPGGGLFTACFQKYGPQAYGKLFTGMHPDLFPVDENGKPTANHLAKLVEMANNPELVPGLPNIREPGDAAATGDSAFWRALYIHDRNDPAIKTVGDLSATNKPITDPDFIASSPNISTKSPYGSPRRGSGSGSGQRDTMELDMADRMLLRFAFQQVVLSCMADQKLDALVYPTNNIPPQKIQSPEEPAVNGRNQAHWVVFGQDGFPAISVPAGFTAQVYDRVPDPASPDGTKLVGPVAARLPVGVDFATRPFGEPTIIRIAAAFERTTKHRQPPPDFDVLPTATK